MGVLFLKLGDYDNAINTLRNIEFLDAPSSLSALRTLARAYGYRGDYDSARMNYLRAASMEGNYTPEKEFNEFRRIINEFLNIGIIKPSKRTFHKRSNYECFNCMNYDSFFIMMNPKQIKVIIDAVFNQY